MEQNINKFVDSREAADCFKKKSYFEHYPLVKHDGSEETGEWEALTTQQIISIQFKEVVL